MWFDNPFIMPHMRVERLYEIQPATSSWQRVNIPAI